MENTESRYMYEQLGISADVWAYGKKIEESAFRSLTRRQSIIS